MTRKIGCVIRDDGRGIGRRFIPGLPAKDSKSGPERRGVRGRLTMSRFLRNWLPVIAYCLFLFLQSSSAPPVDLPEFSHVDKLLHAGAYGFLGILFFRAYNATWPNAADRILAGAGCLFPSIYGLTDEIHQYFVPGRNADPWDWLADTIGAMLVAAAYLSLRRLQTRRSGMTRNWRN